MAQKRGSDGRAGARKVIIENRRARFDYEILETFEAGIALEGPEVKSLRQGRGNLQDAYASVDRGELYLVNAYIPEYLEANRFNHETRRPRKLLLHRREIDRLAGGVLRDGLTIVPLRLFFNPRGRAKAEIALARGKKLHDKRETEKQRSWAREKSRLLKERG
ncbi:MAG TPA: SsrA-binding protein SmpB [Aestuariivirgaceae bacterium]|jgi:SsrA-binding protein|nr:SsrA-binding protein SmpB [Aestuariivirgaceae bacterium]